MTDLAAYERVAVDLAGAVTRPAPSVPVARRQGVITALTNGTPPTVDVNLGASGITVPGCRYLNSLAPYVGQVVIVNFAGSDPLIVGAVGRARWYIRARTNTAYSSAVGWSKVRFDWVVDYDYLSVFNTTTWIYTIPEDGIYVFHGGVLAELNNAVQRFAVCVSPDPTLVGSYYWGSDVTIRGGTAGDPSGLHVHHEIPCTKGQQWVMGLYNSGGNTVNVPATGAGGNIISYFEIARTGPLPNTQA
jgi:hypothetical protein